MASRFQVEVAEDCDVATTQQAGLNKPAWLHRGLGFLTGLAGCMLIASVVPSHSHTESPSAFSLASFAPAGMPAMRGTQTATSSGQTPVLQTWSPMERTAVIPTSSLRNAPPAMQMSSPAYDPLGLEASEESQRAQATTAYAVPTSHINRMQPGQNIINGDSGVSGSTLGWLSILALGTAGAYMAGLSRGTATAEMLSVSQMPAEAGEAPPIGMAMQMLADAGQAPAMADGSTAIAIGGGILAILTAGIPVFFLNKEEQTSSEKLASLERGVGMEMGDMEEMDEADLPSATSTEGDAPRSVETFPPLS